MSIIIINICYISRLPTLDEILKNENNEEEIEAPTKDKNEDLIENITNLFDGATVL